MTLESVHALSHLGVSLLANELASRTPHVRWRALL